MSKSKNKTETVQFYPHREINYNRDDLNINIITAYPRDSGYGEWGKILIEFNFANIDEIIDVMKKLKDNIDIGKCGGGDLVIKDGFGLTSPIKGLETILKFKEPKSAKKVKKENQITKTK